MCGVIMWYIFTGASFAALCATLIATVRKSKKSGSFPLKTLMAGVFVAIVLMFAPIYMESFASESLWEKTLKTFFLSLHHAIRLFIVDSDFDIIRNSVKSGAFYIAYSCYAVVMFVLAPALTFGFVLSFFKNASAYKKYISCYNKDVYIFSEINEKSVALGKSIKENLPDAAVVYADATAEEDEEDDYVKDFAKMRAIRFKKDFLSVNFGIHSKKKELFFFIIGKDEAENVRESLDFIEQYKDREGTWVYVFSNKIEGEILLSAPDKGNLKVRRISDVRTLIYSMLRENGELLFKEAVESGENPDTKLISALVVGLKRYGAEMVKSLAWFGQMAGYKLEIKAIDEDEKAVDKFISGCPELMKDGYNGNFSDDGEAQYNITIKGSIRIDSPAFEEEIESMKEITYVFVDIGDDEENIGAAVKLRSLLAKKGKDSRIQAVVYNSDRKKALEGARNHSGQSFDIDFIGDAESFYTMDNIMNSKLEEEALARHMRWGGEEDFWKFEYNRMSSVASALHKRMKILCNVPGILKEPKERSDAERLGLRKLEHRRWNAYMRSEGYRYAEKRNNLAKTHHCLVTYELLSESEKAKDDD